MTAAILRRELLWFTAAAAVGVLLLPPLIYLVGGRLFGAYAAGGLYDLGAQFFRGLYAGSPAFWTVAAGPYACVTLVRLVRLAASAPAAAGED